MKKAVLFGFFSAFSLLKPFAFTDKSTLESAAAGRE
jgi:hypothetical protein